MPQFQLSPGNSLDYEFIAPGESGFTFTFVNALTGDKAVWADTVVPELTGAGHGALLFNMRGQAGTEFTFAGLDEATIIADIEALMNHVLQGVAVPLKCGMGTNGQITVREHAPDVERLEPLAIIGIDKIIIIHGFLFIKSWGTLRMERERP